MAEIKFYQVDAFSGNVFGGNPAGVCPLAAELPDETMQKIAAENNLPETAFIFTREGRLHIRWFTPETEVDLCGHATLGSAHVMFHHEGFTGQILEFQSKSGALRVKNKGDILELDFPVSQHEPCAEPEGLADALGCKPSEVYASADYMAVFENEQDVINMKPDFAALKKLPLRGVIVTAKGSSCDFVSRFFAPNIGIDEDPVTGSAHCLLTPYWTERLNKKLLTARQVSNRGGLLFCTLDYDRVLIAGRCADYLKGTITLPD